MLLNFSETMEKLMLKLMIIMKLRNLFGELLKEIQRIKSEGDFEAGKENN